MQPSQQNVVVNGVEGSTPVKHSEQCYFRWRSISSIEDIRNYLSVLQFRWSGRTDMLTGERVVVDSLAGAVSAVAQPVVQ